MEQTKDVVTQIRTHYDSFSKSHRRLADFILENLHEVAFLSINELSQRTGISPATITRFARRLDFQGYPDLQRGLYEHQKQWAPFGQLKSLLRRETPAEDAGPDSLQWTIQNNIGLLEALYTPSCGIPLPAPRRSCIRPGPSISPGCVPPMPRPTIWPSCSSRCVTTSICSPPPPATCPLRSVMSIRRTACWSSPMPGTPAPPMTSYPHFHRAGCKIVALTDSLTSPIALKATEVLIAPNGGNFSPVGAITLCNCFITSLGRLNAQQTLERMELQDKIALEHHIYL